MKKRKWSCWNPKFGFHICVDCEVVSAVGWIFNLIALKFLTVIWNCWAEVFTWTGTNTPRLCVHLCALSMVSNICKGLCVHGQGYFGYLHSELLHPFGNTTKLSWHELIDIFAQQILDWDPQAGVRIAEMPCTLLWPKIQNAGLKNTLGWDLPFNAIYFQQNYVRLPLK